MAELDDDEVAMTISRIPSWAIVLTLVPEVIPVLDYKEIELLSSGAKSTTGIQGKYLWLIYNPDAFFVHLDVFGT